MDSLGKLVFKLGAAFTFVSACRIVFFWLAGERVFMDRDPARSMVNESFFSVPDGGGMYEACLSLPAFEETPDFDMTATDSVFDSDPSDPIYIYELELWQESGRDFEGQWEERSRKGCEQFVIDHAGDYGIDLELELGISDGASLGVMYIFELSEKYGSSEPWLPLLLGSVFAAGLSAYVIFLGGR